MNAKKESDPKLLSFLSSYIHDKIENKTHDEQEPKSVYDQFVKYSNSEGYTFWKKIRTYCFHYIFF